MTEKYKDVYLVIKHTFHPAKGSKTHIKGWADPKGGNGRWQVMEHHTVTDSLKSNKVSEASIIINVTQAKIEKFRDGSKDDNAVLVQLVEKYFDDIARFYAVYRPNILRDIVDQKLGDGASDKDDSLILDMLRDKTMGKEQPKEQEVVVEPVVEEKTA